MLSLNIVHHTTPVAHLSLVIEPCGDLRHLRAVAMPRSSVMSAVTEPWLHFPALYLLFGNQMCYIGQTDDLASRWHQHRTKPWWQYAIAFYQQPQPWTKSELMWLEHSLISKALQLHLQLENKQHPTPPTTSATTASELQPLAQLIEQTLTMQGLWAATPRPLGKEAQPHSPSSPKHRHRPALALKPPRTKATTASLVLEGRRWEASSWKQLTQDVLTYLLTTHGKNPFHGLISPTPLPGGLTLGDPPATLGHIAWPSSVMSRKKLLRQWAFAAQVDLEI